MKKHTCYLAQKIIIVTIAATVFFGCRKKDQEEITQTVQTPNAKITGIVKSPSGQVIGSAKIIAGAYKTTSDKNGLFSLDVYQGSYNLKIQTGSGALFKTELNVSVNAGQTLPLSASQSVLQQTGTLAFIVGAFDNIETIIIDTLGYSATAIQVSDLANYSLISSYSALFFNCGSMTIMDSLKYTNLLAYVQNHGSIYASDYGVEFLTGDGNWRLAAPAKQNQASSHTGRTTTACINPILGGFIPDSALCTTYSGNTGLVTNATIYDTDIINLLGKNTMDIYYNLGSWAVINQVGAPFNTIIGHQGYGPLAVKSTSFSNEYGGIIFYTTFHNHYQGNISPDVKNVLQYFILNL